MGSCFHTIVVDAPPSAVWATIRDFHELSWSGAFQSVEAIGPVAGDRVGAKRLLDGAIHETLLALDDAARTLEYSLDDGPGPLSRSCVKSYVGRLRLLPITATGGTLVEWSSRFESQDDAAIQEQVDPAYRDMLRALADHLARAKGPEPGHLLHVGFGFWGSRTLLSAVELELFTVLGARALTGAELQDQLALHPRGVFDLLDALVALRLLEREGDGAAARYRNTPAGALFLDKKAPTYVGGILEMAGARLYPFWADLTEALRTGKPQNEVKRTGASMFEELYREPARLEQFMRAMAGISAGNFRRFAEVFDFSRYSTLCGSATSAARPASCRSSRRSATRT